MVFYYTTFFVRALSIRQEVTIPSISEKRCPHSRHLSSMAVIEQVFPNIELGPSTREARGVYSYSCTATVLILFWITHPTR